MTGIDNGIYSLNVDGMVRMLSKAYVSLIKNNIPLKSFPSVMLWGAPGVGKSQGVREIARIIEKETSKKVVITDVRLLLFNPVDLRGIPCANEDKTLAVWLKPKIFQMDENDDIVNILILDEISSAPPSVQASAYQITLDRMVGEHKLPDNCIVLSAGNRVTDRSVAYNMPKALANRLCHLTVSSDSESWHRWAINNGIHKYVIGYLEHNSAALSKNDANDTALAFPSPRSWEMVSNILNTTSENVDEVYPLLVGCIGAGFAPSFKEWCMLYKKMPTVEAIFKGKYVGVPAGSGLHIALRSAMVSYARLHPVKSEIDNSVTYACRLPWSFRIKLLEDYYNIPALRDIIVENQTFIESVKRNRNDTKTNTAFETTIT